MALSLARFLFGLTLSWSAVAILAAATLVCIRVLGIVVVFDWRRPSSEHAAGGLCVLGIVAGALAAVYAAAAWLQDAIGATALVGGVPHWLAGGNHISAAALLGAIIGVGMLALAWSRMNRDRHPPEGSWAARWAAARTARREARHARLAAQPQRRTSSNDERSTAAAVKKAKAAAPAGRGGKPATKGADKRGSRNARPVVPTRRIPQLGWIALFLLLLGGAVLGFAYGLAPLSAPHDASAAALKQFADQAGRARGIYVIALGLLGAGAASALLWWLVRLRRDE
jgi:hypothetical protein